MSGETIPIRAAEGETVAYLARPDSLPEDATLPGVLLLTDVVGLRPRTMAMADRIASWGHVVLVPHLFYRDAAVEDWAPVDDLLVPGVLPLFFDTVLPKARALTPDVIGPDLTAYLDALLAAPNVAAAPVGVAGYCMGGRFALTLATARPDAVAAVGVFHTGDLVTDESDSPHRHLSGIDAFVLAIHADNDRSLSPSAVAEFEHALTSAGVTHSASVHPGAPHGYTMSDLPAFHHEACEHHFVQLQKVFRRTLRG